MDRRIDYKLKFYPSTEQKNFLHYDIHEIIVIIRTNALFKD